MNLNNGGKKPQRKNWTKEDPNTMDTSIGALTEKDKAALMKIGACFRCIKMGHLSQDCLDKNKTGQQQKNQIFKQGTCLNVSNPFHIYAFPMT